MEFFNWGNEYLFQAMYKQFLSITLLSDGLAKHQSSFKPFLYIIPNLKFDSVQQRGEL